VHANAWARASAALLMERDWERVWPGRRLEKAGCAVVTTGHSVVGWAEIVRTMHLNKKKHG